MSNKQTFTKAKALELVNSLSSYIGKPYGDKEFIYDITIWPVDKVTLVGNKIAGIYQELVHKTGKNTKTDIADLLSDFEEEEEFDVRAVLVSRSEIDNRFYTICYQSVQVLSFY